MPVTHYDNRIAPQNFSEAMELAKWLSRSTMVPERFQGSPENCFLAIQWGSEVGLGPLQTLQDLAIIDGKPALYGDAMLALVRGSGLCELVDESCDGQVAVCRVRRNGEETVERRFSVNDAVQAGLWGMTDAWEKYPIRMLQMRARSWALRDVFPDVLRGVRNAEEAQDYMEQRRMRGCGRPQESGATVDGAGVPAPVPVECESVPAPVEHVVAEDKLQPEAAVVAPTKEPGQRFCSQEKFEKNFPRMAEMIRSGDRTVTQCVVFYSSKGEPFSEEQRARLEAVAADGYDEHEDSQDAPETQLQPPEVVSRKKAYPQSSFRKQLRSWVNVIVNGKQTYETLIAFLARKGVSLSDEQKDTLLDALEEAQAKKCAC
ncbi:MAG: hypothetical protein IKZ87_04145 [Actinomycetaceae bacterium]|nr:hypothetical protein [Actinomycetaceae bacterium]